MDSEALLKQGEVEALEELGFRLSIDECTSLFSGVSVDKAAQNFKERYDTELPADFFPNQIAGSMDLFRARLHSLMRDTVEALAADGISQCVASGSPRARVDLCIDVAGMRPFFPASSIFTRELVSEGKPAPDLFLHAAEKLGIHPVDCLVIEDSTSGVLAAKAASMPVLGYLGGGHAKASWYREKMEALDVDLVESDEEVLAWLRARL